MLYKCNSILYFYLKKLYPDTIFYSNRAVAYRLMNAFDKALLDARKSVEMD